MEKRQLLCTIETIHQQLRKKIFSDIKEIQRGQYAKMFKKKIKISDISNDAILV